MSESLLSLSEADSSRFKLRIIRGRIDEFAACGDALFSDIQSLHADIAIIRLPAGNTEALHALIDRGLAPIHADTLVYHTRDLSDPVTSRRDAYPWDVGLADPDDSAAIASIARGAFSSYRSHYHSNRLLDPALITEGYAQWAISFLTQGTLDRETWVVRQQNKIIAFATCQLTQDNAEIVLNAVDPAYTGQGVYSHMLGKMLSDYRTRHFRAARISTQVWNYTVQRAWARAGFVISHAYDTYHVNALLGIASPTNIATVRQRADTPYPPPHENYHPWPEDDS